MLIATIWMQSCVSYVNVPLSLSTPKPRIVVWPLQLQVVWGRGSTSLQPQPSSPHPHPSTSITVGLPTSLCHGGMVAPPPDPNPPPPPQNTVGQPRSLGMRDENCVGGGGLQVFRLLLCRLVSFRTFSYAAYLHPAPSPTALSFTKHLLL